MHIINFHSRMIIIIIIIILIIMYNVCKALFFIRNELTALGRVSWLLLLGSRGPRRPNQDHALGRVVIFEACRNGRYLVCKSPD